MIGTSLGPDQVVAKLGEGGMGEVNRATDSHLKRQVAIKVLSASMTADADRLARFQREAEVLAALNHPNIAAIYGLEKNADVTALVMELAEGEELSQRIARLRAPGASARQAGMAPEQARGKTVDKRADIRAFGAVLFEMHLRTIAPGNK